MFFFNKYGSLRKQMVLDETYGSLKINQVSVDFFLKEAVLSMVKVTLGRRRPAINI